MVVARAGYHCLSALTNHDTINNLTKYNHKPLIKEIVTTSLDTTKGIPQHKNAFWTHITRTQFDVKLFYDEFTAQTGLDNLKVMSAKVDCRITKEMSVS